MSGVLSVPLLALWRVERGLWEAACLYGPAGRWTLIDMSHAAKLVMLGQIVMLYWLIVWTVYRWVLRRGLRKGTVFSTSIGRCPACGYQSDAEQCPECGARRDDPKAIRPRVVIPWIEKRAWLRWVFRTRTALIVIVVLFFSPVWVSVIKIGIQAVFP